MRRALVITSSVYVSAPLTRLRDPLERERQYIDALRFFIKESPLSRIIVCDNSGYVYPHSLVEHARLHGKRLELLSFTGNRDLVADYGKGYGEGEIMEYIFCWSLLIREVEGFLKVTGRLKVVNIVKVLAQLHPAENYFMPISLVRPRWLVPKAARPCVEVRVYYATRAFFQEILLRAHRDVRDDQTFFLEHAYYKAIAEAAENHAATNGAAIVKSFPTVPEIIGVSGSNGWTFRERGPLRKAMIKAAYHLGYIKPI